MGVDALVGMQLRSHDDLDIVVDIHDVPPLRAVLRGAGYASQEGVDVPGRRSCRRRLDRPQAGAVSDTGTADARSRGGTSSARRITGRSASSMSASAWIRRTAMSG